MLQKASQTLPDAFIPDLEDSVAFDDKEEARQVVSDHLDMLIATGTVSYTHLTLPTNREV